MRRFSWVWLAVGTALLPFINFQTAVPVAAWLAPVFLLRFARGQRLTVAMPVLVLVNSAAMLVALRHGFFPFQSGIGYYLFILGLGFAGMLPYLADRLLVRRLGGLTGTLVFPLAATAADWIGTFGNPFGTAGSVAYSQYSDLALVQVVSLTGIWGLTFLINWLAPVANLAWEHGLHWRTTRAATSSFGIALLAVLFFGGAQLAFGKPQAPTVRVAALAPNHALADRANAVPLPHGGPVTNRVAARTAVLDPILDDLFDRSRQAARAGARIVTWSEAAAYVFAEDLPATIARGQQLARDEAIYLQLGVISILPSTQFPVNENRAILLDPAGAIAWNYAKSKPTPGDGHRPGPGVIPVVDTPYGRIATAICQDDFFPDLVRQAGRQGADILLLPSSDWRPIADWHAQVAPTRAIENGVAVVRPTRQGTSLVTDHQGRLLGYKADYFAAHEQTLITALPTRGATTIYPRIGDVFAYTDAAALAVLVGVAIRRRRGGDPTPPSAPDRSSFATSRHAISATELPSASR
jgi:apolipoprotein N-acyltransferase